MPEKGISWKYYGEGWNIFITSPDTRLYCNICNPFLYETAIMTQPTIRTAHLKDTLDLYNDIANGELPAVSYAQGVPRRPSGILEVRFVQGFHQEDHRSGEGETKLHWHASNWSLPILEPV
jgi:hypothetical protein